VQGIVVGPTCAGATERSAPSSGHHRTGDLWARRPILSSPPADAPRFVSPRQGLSNRVIERYLKLVAEGHFERDAAQESVARKLDRLCERFETEGLAKKSSALGWLFGTKRTEETTRGLYIWVRSVAARRC